MLTGGYTYWGANGEMGNSCGDHVDGQVIAEKGKLFNDSAGQVGNGMHGNSLNYWSWRRRSMWIFYSDSCVSLYMRDIQYTNTITAVSPAMSVLLMRMQCVFQKENVRGQACWEQACPILIS